MGAPDLSDTAADNFGLTSSTLLISGENMNALSCFAPHVRKHLEEVLKYGRIGLSPGSVKVTNPMISCSGMRGNLKCDRFKMIIPYAGQTLTWDVIFQSRFPDFAPDFVFSDSPFPAFVKLEEMESLLTWNTRDSNGLLNVTKELLHIYQKQQVQLLENFSRVHAEYLMLLQQTDVQDEDIEIFISQKNRNGPITFLIRLPIDFSRIPPILCHDNPDEDLALLLITFHTPEGNRITPQLFLSPKVEHAVGGAQVWKLPSFPGDENLVHYVSSISDLLGRKVEHIVLSFEKRKDYIATFLSHLGRCLIEYDAELYTKIVFLLESNGFYFIVHINLSLNFPIEKPYFTFQSIYHTISGKPFSANISDYPYSPRWSSHEMFERAKIFFEDYVPVFQRNSIKYLDRG